MTALRPTIIAYQRHRERIENALLAAGLALLVGLFLEATGAFGYQWRAVLLLAIFALGTHDRDWGYLAAIGALAWPMWGASPYLMALFLAVTLLPRSWIVDHLPWALLVVAAPLLAQWHALALVPLLAGLMAGPTVGWWSGLLAALWLVLVAGLSGWMGELGALHGAPFAWGRVAERLSGANSLETLQMVAAPFARGSLLLLLHLLQAVGWGLGGWLTGWLRRLEWRSGEPRFVLIPTLAAGALLLWGALYVVPSWLGVQTLTAFVEEPLPTAGLALSALATALIAQLYGLGSRPVPPRIRRPRVQVRMGREGPQTVVDETAPRRPWSDRRRPEEEDDVIMLELD